MPTCLHCGKPRLGSHDGAGNCLLKYTEAPLAAQFVDGGVRAQIANLRTVAEHHTREGSASRKRLDDAIALLNRLKPEVPVPSWAPGIWSMPDLSGIETLELSNALLDALKMSTAFTQPRDAFITRASLELAHRNVLAAV